MLDDEEWVKASVEEKLDYLRGTVKATLAGVGFLAGQCGTLDKNFDEIKTLTAKMAGALVHLKEELDANKSSTFLQRLFRG